MLSFFYKGHRFILSIFVVCLILSICFFSPRKNVFPKSALVDDVSYQVGNSSYKRYVKRAEIDAMKAFLSLDLGYGFNDVLQRQNVFGEGFFIDLMHSSFGSGLVDRFFPLVKEDFAKRVKGHKRFRFYKHPSGEFSLEDKLKERALPFYDLYKKVVNKEREVDESLLKDYIHLCFMQKSLRPSVMHNLVASTIKFQKLGYDETVDRRNYALFNAKNHEEVFGSAFTELCAQVIIECGKYCKDHGYDTSYEEAEGLIMRRAMGNITQKYNRVEDLSKLKEILATYQVNLGIKEKDLVGVCQNIINFQKMLKDIDASILLDKLTISKLFSDRLDTILVTLISDCEPLKVRGVEDAIELQCYLESIGDTTSFLSVPEKEYEQSVREQKAPELFIKRYELKIGAVKKSVLANSLPLKKVWDFQTSNQGWDLLQEKFSLENKGSDERFAFLKSLGEERRREIEKYALERLLEEEDSFLQGALERQPLKKVMFDFNRTVSSNLFYEGFDENALEELLGQKQEGEEISLYSQDGEHYFRIYLLKKPEKQEMVTFALAKERGYLKVLLEDKLQKLNKGKKVLADKKRELLEKLLAKEGGDQVCKAIMEVEKEKKIYPQPMIKRLEDFNIDENKELSPLLLQFAIVKRNEVITKSGKNYLLFREEFLHLKEGEISSVQYEENNSPYKVVVNGFKVDEQLQESLAKNVAYNIASEAKGKLYEKLLSHIQEDKMLEISRFEKGKAL